jgi:hypothetical protein
MVWTPPMGLLLTAILLVGGTAAGAAQQPSARAVADTLADFKTRVDAYVALRRKVESALPGLSKEATPREIDRHQRAFLTGIAIARVGAKPGDVFTPPVQQAIKAVIVKTFANADRQSLRESIQDENPGPLRVTVNGRYPDAVPLANMPADLLRNLPPLPEPLEYRFVGESLILLDSAAHLVIDLIPGALPR